MKVEESRLYGLGSFFLVSGFCCVDGWEYGDVPLFLAEMVSGDGDGDGDGDGGGYVCVCVCVCVCVSV